MPEGGARGQNLVHLQVKVSELKFSHQDLYLDQRNTGGLTFSLWHPTPVYTTWGGARGKDLELFKLLYFKFLFHILTTAVTRKL